jgi:hypothetical protein
MRSVRERNRDWRGTRRFAFPVKKTVLHAADQGEGGVGIL